jgi:hypothetical protein
MARRAALLLVLILGHLVLMATPVHARALVHAGPGVVAAAPHAQHAAPVGGATVALRPNPAAETPADCAFEPAPPPGGPAARLLAGQGPSVPILPKPGLIDSVGPAACATGPLLVLLSQPFLQVFRA